jgi:hypothetical protein
MQSLEVTVVHSMPCFCSNLIIRFKKGHNPFTCGTLIPALNPRIGGCVYCSVQMKLLELMIMFNLQINDSGIPGLPEPDIGSIDYSINSLLEGRLVHGVFGEILGNYSILDCLYNRSLIDELN